MFADPHREQRRMARVTCKDFILDFLADYLDGKLSPQIAAELERHLAI